MADVADMELTRRTDPVNEVLGELLRQARSEQGMTQVQAARRAEISRGSVANIERGEQGISVALLLRLATALEADPAQLIRQAQAKLAQRPIADQIPVKLRQTLDERELLWVLSSLPEKSS